MSLDAVVSSQMSAKGAALGESFLADFAFVRPLPGVSSPMFHQVLPRAERFPAKLADLRFLAGVYPNVRLHVLSSDQLPADLAGDLALAGVRGQVFLVTVAVKRLKLANLALVSLPGLRLAVDLHVAPQVDHVAERFVTDLAGAGLVVAVHAHVGPQGGLQVKTFVADLAELGELLVVPSDVDLQVVLRSQFRAAHVANVRRTVQGFVDVQILLLLEDLVADVALDRAGLLTIFRRIGATRSPMLEQLHLLRERFPARVA